MTSLVAGALLAAPGVAVAADAGAPPQPLVGDLSTWGSPCAAGEGRPFVRAVPNLTARLYGAGDHQPGEASRVSGEFEAWWLDGDGSEERLTFATGMRSDSTPFSWQLPAEIPADTVISWRVRAVDGEVASPWSTEGEGAPCEFVLDRTAPGKPVVTSADYPDNNNWTDGAGVYGTFHVDSPTDDVVSYVYDFQGGPLLRATPSGPEGSADLRYLPPAGGVFMLHVQAQDRAGNLSSPTYYTFRVASGRAPAAHWSLADAAGSRTAAATAGAAARAGIGASFGSPAPSGTALTSTATLDGTGHGFLTPDASVVGAGKTFAAGGWVRPSAVDSVRTIASQDGFGAPEFALGLRQEDGGPVWSFAVNGTRMTGGLPEAGEWAHVLGAYDAETGRARLYVNGRAVGEEEAVTPVAAEGNFQIGRSHGASGYRDRWKGEIGDVRVHDRVVAPAEITRLGSRAAQLRGHWALENAPEGISAEAGGGEPLKLAAGASIFRAGDECDLLDPDCIPGDWPLADEGHLSLDGTAGYAATDKPVVDTDDSFTVSATVRLADNEPAHPMTALSQGGVHGDAFKVRYTPATQSWELVMSHADAPGAAETVVARVEWPDGGQGGGHRLAVVYDDATDRVRLFVDGHADAGGTAEFHDAWESDGGLQVGRGRTADGWGEYLRGAVDQVRVFSGVVPDQDIAGLM
ncbi:LamG-like jellyroll fold domain-containing protein [Streptomyces sp. NPDC058620]|uniref:LamG domain-containing protein n=1 Tax=Streptomyces sp. NPDC058620 TaxID=3346560 RepID=UPI00365E0FB3